MSTNYSKKRRVISDNLFKRYGLPIYKNLYGNNISVETSQIQDDFEGIDRYVKRNDQVIDKVSDRFRKYKSTESNKNIGMCDDITIRSCGLGSRELEISHMSTDKFLYVVENENETDTERWHFYNIKLIIESVFGGIIDVKESGQYGQNKFWIVQCKDIRNIGYMIAEGKTVDDAMWECIV